MVKTPKTRHSKSRRDPVTIELEPGAVSRITGEDAAVAEDNAAETDTAKAAGSQPEAPDEPIHAEQTDIEPWEHADAAQGTAGEPEAKGMDEAEAPYPDGSAAPKSEPKGFGYDFEDASQTKASSAASAPKPSETRNNDSGSTASRRSGVNTIAAGLIGGVVALAGAGLLQAVGLLGSPASNGASLDGVNGEIASLKSEIAALKQTGDAGASAKVDGLSSALDQVKSDIAALKSSAGQGGDSTALKALNDKVGQIETAVADLQKAGSTATVDLGPLNEKLAGLDALVKSAGEAAKAADGRIAALEQSVQQLSGKVDAQASQPKIALAIAASALKAALDRGAPFATELDTFAAIAPDAPEIAVLRSYAEKGVPTRATIASEIEAAASAMVDAATPVDQNAGFFQSLVSSAESLVKVRPVGAVEGKGAPETVARMEVAVNQGDYAKALSEYDTLPDAAKTAGADFAGKLKARLEVEKQIDALIAGATKA
ncbi:phage tail protein [Mesorhizobium sp. M1C.F.Ca.ET.193.01.1.1]|uniref:COG4223 family protein n=1 Tax=unclassified Mesorhizobium TaxID=325217 RepID=UPI000FD19403|nr:MULTISPECIES: mitofilin family membrane protein [unclassified Mesorhizobium]TGS92504.1 phage tail protein [bacterium M00.F.Ca.ET.177.01.1.1]TGQ50217.1 phage tail protein [Mesorhizobium sp. M1C.F.Ca.ET.210.01.1.1]TGQ64904.1 phage tail protein [Mesorhizobium sp. M1C.F.Ca.ET.212.01.1.1]TGQ98687.1 phage tail protein [Mesorhizobium sp. M1C.F.Ca.ET.204.01.1.1]TGR18984.1 phage tail protein [Mesorhizobium sp. M1C.F.Ca.ET.196.01.1.1]